MMTSFTSAVLGAVQHPANILPEYLEKFRGTQKVKAFILTWIDGWIQTKNKQGKAPWVYLVVKEVAKAYGCCRDTIHRHLKELCERKILKRLPYRRWATDNIWEYTIDFDVLRQELKECRKSAALPELRSLHKPSAKSENQTPGSLKTEQRESENRTMTVQNQNAFLDPVPSSPHISLLVPPAEPSKEKEWVISEDVWAAVAADCLSLEQEQTPTPGFVEIPEEILVVEPEIQSVDHPVTANENHSQATEQVAEFVESPTVDEFYPQSTTPGAGFSQRSTPKPVKRGDRTKEVWEIALGRPYPVFLNWRAKTKYEPQEGRWAADALGNAYSEFYNNRAKTTIALFPQFLQYMKQVAENCNQSEFASLKAILPSLFVALPDPTEENVQQLMDNVQRLIDNGASVALPQGIGTSSCSQSIGWDEAQGVAIAPLSQLESSESICLPAVMGDIGLAAVVERKRSLWRNAPILREGIKKWASETDGVELGENGPVLLTI